MYTIFRHYKGKHYLHLGTALHADSLEPVEVYRCLYDNDAGPMWIRPQAAFHGALDNGQTRFVPIARVRKGAPEDDAELLPFGYDAWNKGRDLDTFLRDYDKSPNFQRGTRYLIESLDGTKWAKLNLLRFQRNVTGVASVATKPEHRRAGHASLLLHAVLEIVKLEEPDTRFLLFSEVRPAIYERIGFRVLPDELQRFLPSLAMATGSTPLKENERRWIEEYF